jgi:hypothetical protein
LRYDFFWIDDSVSVASTTSQLRLPNQPIAISRLNPSKFQIAGTQFRKSHVRKSHGAQA